MWFIKPVPRPRHTPPPPLALAGLSLVLAVTLSGCVSSPKIKEVRQGLLYRHGTVLFEVAGADPPAAERGAADGLTPRQPDRRELRRLRRDLEPVPETVLTAVRRLESDGRFRALLARHREPGQPCPAGDPLGLPLAAPGAPPSPRGVLYLEDVRRLYAASFPKSGSLFSSSLTAGEFLRGVRGYERGTATVFGIMGDAGDRMMEQWDAADALNNVSFEGGAMYKRLWAVAALRHWFFTQVACGRRTDDGETLADAYALLLLVTMFRDATVLPDEERWLSPVLAAWSEDDGRSPDRPGFDLLALYVWALADGTGEERAAEVKARLTAAERQVEDLLREAGVLAPPAAGEEESADAS